MDTLEHMRNAVNYIEAHLAGELEYSKIAQAALCSPYHFQRMFAFLVGVPLSEYIRRRRLTLAALDLQNGGERVIDIAVKYGYSSADAFSRAFQALHGVSPSGARVQGVSIKAYPRISFSLSLKGVTEMNYRIEKKPAFQIVGIKDRFSHVENLGKSVGGMWAALEPETAQRITALSDAQPPCLVGAYSEMYADNTTDYYIGSLSSASCPAGFVALAVPVHTWAVFEIVGALPAAMAEVWGRIFSEWFPTTGYEHAQGPEIEWYSAGDMGSDDYRSEIWIPIAKQRL